MKILEIGGTPPPYSGTTIPFAYFCKYLRDNGVEIKVLNIGKSRLKRKSKSCVKGPFDYAVKCFIYALKGYDFHMHEFFESFKGLTVTFVPAFISFIMLRKFVFTCFGGEKQYYFAHKTNIIESVIIWFILRRSNSVICDSIEVKEKIVQLGCPSKKIHPIQCWSRQYVNLKTDLPEDLNSFFNHHGFIFMSSFVVRMAKYDLLTLVKAIDLFQNKYDSVGFVLLAVKEDNYSGRKDWITFNRLIGRINTKNRILVLKDQAHLVSISILKKSNAFIRTPPSDGVSSSVLESLKLKKPTIANNGVSRPKSVILYQSYDPNDLLAKMEDVYLNYDIFKKRTYLEASYDKDSLMEQFELLKHILVKGY